MKRALLLNADWTPLNFISDIRAFNLVYKGRAEVVSFDDRPSTWDEKFMTVTMAYDVPATIRLLNRVNKKWKPPRFRKKVLFNRDSWTCQYCRKPLFYHNVTIDHVLPKSRGGITSWKNCVAACKPCNKKKADMLPSEAGMPLLKKPIEPTPNHFWDSQKTSVWHNDWEHLLPRD